MKKLVLLAAMVLGLVFGGAVVSQPQVNAAKVQTSKCLKQNPAQLRGTWYSYDKQLNKYTVVEVTNKTLGTTSVQAARMLNIALEARIPVSYTRSSLTSKQLITGQLNQYHAVKLALGTGLLTNTGATVITTKYQTGRTYKTRLTVVDGTKTMSFYKTKAQAKTVA